MLLASIAAILLVILGLLIYQYDTLSARMDRATIGMTGAATAIEACNNCLDDGQKVDEKAIVPAAFTDLTMAQALERFEKQTDGIYYFGYPDCPWCQQVEPILEKEMKPDGPAVFYIRTRDDNHELLYTEEEKEKLLKYIGPYMSENDEGEKTLYVPCLVNYQNGKAFIGHVGTVDGHDATEREMTKKERNKLTTIVRKILDANAGGYQMGGGDEKQDK